MKTSSFKYAAEGLVVYRKIKGDSIELFRIVEERKTCSFLQLIGELRNIHVPENCSDGRSVAGLAFTCYRKKQQATNDYVPHLVS